MHIRIQIRDVYLDADAYYDSDPFVAAYFKASEPCPIPGDLGRALRGRTFEAMPWPACQILPMVPDMCQLAAEVWMVGVTNEKRRCCDMLCIPEINVSVKDIQCAYQNMKSFFPRKAYATFGGHPESTLRHFWLLMCTAAGTGTCDGLPSAGEGDS